MRLIFFQIEIQKRSRDILLFVKIQSCSYLRYLELSFFFLNSIILQTTRFMQS